ncbi:9496_t:CDS:2, partial [Racocetra fulgida]
MALCKADEIVKQKGDIDEIINANNIKKISEESRAPLEVTVD